MYTSQCFRESAFTHSQLNPSEDPNAQDSNVIDELFLRHPSLLKLIPTENSKSSKNINMILSKCNPKYMPQLLSEHSQATILYQTRDFTQQTDCFLSKLCFNEAVPAEFKTKLPFYRVLCSLSKIFMLSDIEITCLACAFDQFSWKVDDYLSLEEGTLLLEFPLNSGMLDKESKRLTLYLIMIIFSVKQNLCEEDELKKIQAYCEKICTDFADLYNRWLRRLPPLDFLDFPAKEVDQKFKWLTNQNENPKSLNMMVDSILEFSNLTNILMISEESKEQPETLPTKNKKRQHKKKSKVQPKEVHLEEDKNVVKSEESWTDMTFEASNELGCPNLYSSISFAKQSSSGSLKSVRNMFKMAYEKSENLTKKIKFEKELIWNTDEKRNEIDQIRKEGSIPEFIPFESLNFPLMRRSSSSISKYLV